MKTRRFVYLALLAAMAIALNLFESAFIGSFAYGIRIGLANIIALITMKFLGVREMLAVNALRVIIGNLLRGLLFAPSFFIGAGGVILSSLVLVLLNRTGSSVVFTSVLSSLAHSAGQLLIVILLYHQPGMAVLLPYLMLGSIGAGILTGVTAALALKRIEPLRLNG